MIVEDHADLRRLLEILLRRDERLTLDRSYDNATDALGAARSQCSDVIVCDVGLPGMSGLDAVPLLRVACPDALIVMYTGYPDRARNAESLGADAVVSKDTLPAQLFERVVELVEQRAHS